MLRGILVATASLLSAGCGTIRVTPPSSTSDPVWVHIADYGDTARLLLPRPDDSGSYTEFGYGDYRWYAENKTNLLYGSVVFIVPTGGCIARRSYSHGLVATREGLGADEVITISVERDRATALFETLTKPFDDDPDAVVHNKLRALDFARAARPYWLFNQSSSVLSGWLRDLGCETRGWTVVADFELLRPSPAPATTTQ